MVLRCRTAFMVPSMPCQTAVTWSIIHSFLPSSVRHHPAYYALNGGQQGGLENTTDILDRYGELATATAATLDQPVPGYTYSAARR